MKQFLGLAIVALAFTACNAPEGDKATTGEEKTVVAAEGTPYPVDSSSTVTWIGTKPGGSHTGLFAISTGNLLVKDNNVTGGNFTINVASLKNTDLAATPEDQAILEGHLKSPDFFDVAKFPTASFVITGVEPFIADSANVSMTVGATHKLTGNLTLKDKTKSVSFPAKVTVDATSATAMADFNIDRTEWEMNYKGPNNPQDWVISKTVNIKIALSSTKK